MRTERDWHVGRDAASGLARWNGHVDPKRLEALRKEMGIEWPVKVKRMAGLSRKGTHRTKFRAGGKDFYHSITLSTYLSVYHANATLKHEMMHAVQVEKYARDSEQSTLDALRMFQNEYKAVKRKRNGYKNSTVEAEANAADALYPDAITQNPLLNERRTRTALESIPLHWLPHLHAYQKGQAQEQKYTKLREHFKALVEAEAVDIDPVTTARINSGIVYPDPNAMRERREAREREEQEKLAAMLRRKESELLVAADSTLSFRQRIANVKSENTMTDKPNERSEIEAKLKAWRAERGLPMPAHGEWTAMVNKQLAKSVASVEARQAI